MEFHIRLLIIFFAALVLVLILEFYYHAIQTKRQNIKAINLYLDKQLINKLLNIILNSDPKELVSVIAEEIMLYFCLESIILSKENNFKYISFSNNGANLFLTNNQIEKYFDKLDSVEQEQYIEEEKLGNSTITLLKNHTSMIIVTENGYKLNQQELNTILNDILTIFRIAFRYEMFYAPV
ncbi:MAG: hypothetical protein SFT68_02180 [Rickettsiaceae bacterium]|nr:hypothetical protein [Rickettsiaceae bacterium]